VTQFEKGLVMIAITSGIGMLAAIGWIISSY
jgi:hypothetical protein